MKTEGKTRHKLKQVLYRHLQKRIKAIYKPSGCIHNKPGIFHEQTLGMCQYSNRGKHLVVCDSDVEGCKQVTSNCSWFKPKQSKEDVKTAFKELAGDPARRGQLAYEYPDVAALMWVLGDIGDLDEYLGLEDPGPLPVETSDE